MSFIIHALVSGNELVKTFRNFRETYFINTRNPNEPGQEATSEKLGSHSKDLLFLVESCMNPTTAESISNRPSNSASGTEAVGRKCPGPPSKRRNDDTTETTFMRTPLPTSTPPDGDRAFFESLLHTVHMFNTDQKLIFRAEVLQLLRSMRMRNHPYSSPGYSLHRTQQPTHTHYNWPKNQFRNSPPAPHPPIIQQSNTTISSPSRTVDNISSRQCSCVSVDDGRHRYQ